MSNEGAKVISVDFKKKKVLTTFTYEKTKRAILLEEIKGDLEKLRLKILMADTNPTFDRFFNSAVRSIIEAFRKIHFK
jgi:hypothetical protein